MALVSCPPTSMMVRRPGARKRAPLAWQLISVICLSAPEKVMRP